MSFLNRTLLLFALPTLLGTVASAQTLTPQIKKSIDAQAFAFSGQHCSEHYVSKPARSGPADRFDIMTKILDMTFEDLQKQHPEITFRSDNNGKDLYRAVIGKPSHLGFMVAYWQQGKMYTYGCDLR